jgi:hypothetical protein
MNWSRLTYSVCIAILITAISYVQYGRGGEFVLRPGIVSQVMFNGLLLAVPSGDVFYSLPSGAYLIFNVTFYASIVFGALLLIAHMSAKTKGVTCDYPFSRDRIAVPRRTRRLPFSLVHQRGFSRSWHRKNSQSYGEVKHEIKI